MTAPVALIGFNRPEVIRRTLAAIRQAAPAELFLLADGPRPDHPDDAERCAAVRRELEAIDWPCQVHRRFQEANAGLDASIELGLDWVFETVEEAIILEDDCLPNADFFAFCTELLERYRDEPGVWQISGRAPNADTALFGRDSYAFTAFGAVWGWATWRRAWTAHRRLYPRSHTGPPPAPIAHLDLSGSHLLTTGMRRYCTDVMRDPAGARFCWDSYWCVSIVRARGLVANPRANLIENIGFGAHATHVQSAMPQHALEPVDWPLRHPAAVAVNAPIERVYERVLISHVGRAARLAAKLLSNGRVRSIVRAAVGLVRDRRARVHVR